MQRTNFRPHLRLKKNLEMQEVGGATSAAKISHVFKVGLSKGPIANQIPVPERVWPYLWDAHPLSFLW